MKTIDQLLQQLYKESDDATVSLAVAVPLGMLRQRHDLFANLQIDNVDQNASSTTNKSSPQEPAVEPKPRTKHAAKKKKPGRSTSKRAPTKVTVSGVTQALAEGHHSPTAIAKVLGTSSKVVSTSLSRYLKKGLVVRTGPGEYGLPPGAAANISSAD